VATHKKWYEKTRKELESAKSAFKVTSALVGVVGIADSATGGAFQLPFFASIVCMVCVVIPAIKTRLAMEYHYSAVLYKS
jgi:hypothetical protein